MVSNTKGFIRKGIYSIEEIREVTKDVLFSKENKLADIVLDGDVIHGNSKRYQTFFTKGCTCIKCEIEGKFFAKERPVNVERYHLNLYGYDEAGQEILMTKDHIIPRSKGGSNQLSNFQTMCIVCNEKKGNTVEN